MAERGTGPWNDKAAGWMVWPQFPDGVRRKAAEWVEKLFQFRFRERMSIRSPLEGERFVIGETTLLDASLLSLAWLWNSKGVSWTSSQDGHLGTGSPIVSLSTGTHVITATKGLFKKSVNVRVFADLWSLYQAPPAQAEMDRIISDFTFEWVDGSTGGAGQQWASYPGYPFDQTSGDPSRTAVICKLDVLRHQRFSEPLHFGTQTFYEQVRRHTHTLSVSLGDSWNHASGTGVVNLNRLFALWSAMPWEPNVASAYIHSLYLLNHESRHNEPGDPSHTSCPEWNDSTGVPVDNQDEEFEPGSGHARAALYSMWVLEYGLYDPEWIRKEVKDLVLPSLKSRFCSKPASNNPTVQALLTKLWGT